jgi:hypothetical protein
LIAPQTLTSELLDMVALEEPAVVCIAALPPGGLAHTRYLCKRLSARYPELRIIVGRWGEEPGAQDHRKELEVAGASSTATTLLETRQQLHTLLPLLDCDRPDRPGAQGAPARDSSKSAPSNSRSPLHRAAIKELAARTAVQ